jgi:membrane-associated phospholipid phosphatase
MVRDKETTWPLPALLAALVVVIGFSLFSYYYLDIPVAIYCKSIGPIPKNIFNFLTEFGRSTWYLVFCVIMFFYFRYLARNVEWSNKFLFIFLSISISGILTDIIKFICGRYRPDALFEINQYGLTFFEHTFIKTSFPSGHSNTITALMLALYFLYPRYWTVYTMIAIVVISSRVVLCDHYLSDVIFGSYLAILTTTYLKSIFYRKHILISASS